MHITFGNYRVKFNSAPTPPPDPATPANDDEANPSIAQAERRLRVLGRMTDIGMRLLEKFDPDAAGAPAPDLALAWCC